MHLAQLQRPLHAAASGVVGVAFMTQLRTRRVQLRFDAANAAVEGRRHATVRSQGQYKYKPKKTHPKKLGAKRTGDQFVIPGNIIYKQRGTLWWPGENCIMGRDHTIHANATGYVKYYRDPSKHPGRKYIGVVFNKTDTLPYPLHAERKRKLNMNALPISQPVPEPDISPSGIPASVIRPVEGKVNGLPQGDKILRLRKDYSYREDNWRIGQLVNTAGVKTRKLRSRRVYFRRRRWVRERMIAGEKKAAAKRRLIEEEGNDEWDGTAMMNTKATKAARPSKGKKKGKKR